MEVTLTYSTIIGVALCGFVSVFDTAFPTFNFVVFRCCLLSGGAGLSAGGGAGLGSGVLWGLLWIGLPFCFGDCIYSSRFYFTFCVLYNFANVREVDEILNADL